MSDPTEPEAPHPLTPTPASPQSADQQASAYQTPVATYQNPPHVEQTPGVPVTLVKEKTNGLAVTALVLGIVALVLAFIPFVNFFGAFVALVGLVLGAVSIFQKRASKGIAITGTAISFVAGIMSIIMITAYAAAFVQAVDDSVAKPVASAAAATPGASPAPSAAPADSNFTFGQTVTYKDGLAITVSAPAPYTPSDSAAGATQASNIVFTFTVTNGTGKNYDPTIYTTVSSSGTEADSIIDIGSDIGNQPTTTILAGQSTTWKEAYSVADPAHLVMDVSPGFGYNKSTFTN